MRERRKGERREREQERNEDDRDAAVDIGTGETSVPDRVALLCPGFLAPYGNFGTRYQSICPAGVLQLQF